MAFEDAETTVTETTPEGTGETEGSSESADTSSAESSSSSTPVAEPSVEASESESTAPSVDWTTIDAEELYKHRPELKPKSAEEIKAELLASDEVKRQIQSEKDKEIAKEKRRLTKEARERDRQEALRKAALEKQRLREEEDYEGLGKLVADEEREALELLERADLFKEAGETWIRDNPEYVSTLGEDRVDEIIESVKSRRGNFYEIQFELSKALAEKRTEQVRGEVEKSITDRVNEAVEAALAAAGVKQRSEAVEAGEAASPSIASGASPKISSEKMDWKRSADLYAAGERTWEEHKPFYDQHMKEINK